MEWNFSVSTFREIEGNLGNYSSPRRKNREIKKS
jgi:hypothetical protein